MHDHSFENGPMKILVTPIHFAQGGHFKYECKHERGGKRSVMCISGSELQSKSIIRRGLRDYVSEKRFRF